MVDQCVQWNEDIGEWQLKCVAYTGNNMRKQNPPADKDKNKVYLFVIIQLQYCLHEQYLVLSSNLSDYMNGILTESMHAILELLLNYKYT